MTCIAVVSGLRLKVRKDTECPFLRNVIDPSPLDVKVTPTMDNTGCFVQRTSGLTYSNINYISREAFEIIGAHNPKFRYCSQSGTYYVSVFGNLISWAYGEEYQILFYEDTISPTLYDMPNPCIKACEGFDPTAAHSGFVHTNNTSVIPSNRTVLLYAE